MRILDAIRDRRSVRVYRARPIPARTLARVLKAGRLAPSAKNIQPWKFIVVTKRAARKELAWACNGQSFIARAPVIICGTAQPRIAYARMGGYMSSYAIDLAIALEHMILQATAEGLGTCWIGSFDEEAVKNILGVPAEVRVVALTPLGYPATVPAARPRKPLAEVVSYERYGES